MRVVNKHTHTRTALDTYIGRGSKWGNPFVIGKDGTRSEVLAKYRTWLFDQEQLLSELGELRGRTLVCFCAPQACHGQILCELVEILE